jgi:hypothetical protein
MTTDEVNQIIWAAQDRAMQFDLAIKELSDARELLVKLNAPEWLTSELSWHIEWAIGERDGEHG